MKKIHSKDVGENKKKINSKIVEKWPMFFSKIKKNDKKKINKDRVVKV